MLRALFVVITAAIAAIVGALLWWRSAAERRSMPCPIAFRWFLDSGLRDRVFGAKETLDRAGIQPGMQVLEVGPGVGYITEALARRVEPNGSVTAVEIQPKMAGELRRRLVFAQIENVKVVDGDAQSMPIEGQDQYDRAILVTVLGEIPDKVAALKQIHRLLKPGGILSITENLPDPHYVSRNRIRELAMETGFIVVEEIGPIWFSTLNLQKPALS